LINFAFLEQSGSGSGLTNVAFLEQSGSGCGWKTNVAFLEQSGSGCGWKTNVAFLEHPVYVQHDQCLMIWLQEDPAYVPIAVLAFAYTIK
jgi:hypothetical protein